MRRYLLFQALVLSCSILSSEQYASLTSYYVICFMQICSVNIFCYFLKSHEFRFAESLLAIATHALASRKLRCGPLKVNSFLVVSVSPVALYDTVIGISFVFVTIVMISSYCNIQIGITIENYITQKLDKLSLIIFWFKEDVPWQRDLCVLQGILLHCGVLMLRGQLHMMYIERYNYALTRIVIRLTSICLTYISHVIAALTLRRGYGMPYFVRFFFGFIGYLVDTGFIPLQMINVEEHLTASLAMSYANFKRLFKRFYVERCVVEIQSDTSHTNKQGGNVPVLKSKYTNLAEKHYKSVSRSRNANMQDRLNRGRNNPIATEYVYENGTHKRMKLNTFLSELRMNQIGPIIGSFSRMKPPIMRTQEEKDLYVERMRVLSYLTGKIDVEEERNGVVRTISVQRWTQSSERESLRDWLYSIYFSEQAPVLRNVASEDKVPSCMTYFEHNDFFLDRFPNEMFERVSAATHKKPGKTKPAKLANVSEYVSEDSSYDFLLLEAFANTRSKWLTPSVIKGILKTQMEKVEAKKITHKDIISYFGSKMPLWDLKQPLSVALLRKSAWFACYLQGYHYTISSQNIQQYSKALRELVVRLRDRILNYVRKYLDLSLLSKKERSDVMAERAKLFADYMRTPEIQALFLSGMTHEQVTNYVYKNYIDVINARSLRSKTQEVKIANKSDIERIVSQKRNQVDCDEEWETLMPETSQNDTRGPNRRRTDSTVTTIVDDEGFAIIGKKGKTLKQRHFNNVTVESNPVLSGFFGCFYTCVCVLVNPSNWPFLFGLTKMLRLGYDFVCIVARNHVAIKYYCVYKTYQWSVCIGKPIMTRPEYDAYMLQMLEHAQVVDFYHLYVDFVKYNKESVIMWTAVLHSIISLACGDYYGAATHLNYVHFLYPDNWMVSLLVTNFRFVAAYFQLKNSAKNLYCGSSSSSVEVESKEMDILLDFMASCGTSVSGMTNEEIRNANQQYTLLRHQRNTITSRMNVFFILVSVFCRTCFSYDPFDPDYQAYVAEVMNLIRTIRVFNDRKHEIPASKELMTEIMSTHEDSVKIQLNNKNDSLPHFLQSTLKCSLKTLEELSNTCRQQYQGSEFRVEPVCVMLMGPPGTGKSPFCSFAVNYLEHLHGGKYSSEKSFHMGKSEYFEGYAQQRYVLFDDFFAATDNDRRLNEALNIIHMVNSAPMNLDMAFDGKGANYFKSEYVFISSNLEPYSVEGNQFPCGLTDPKAVVKRINLCLVRRDPGREDVTENEYYIDKCDAFPELKGRTLKTVDLVKLIYRMRAAKVAKRDKYDYSNVDFSMYDDVPQHPPHDVNVELEAAPVPRVSPYTHLKNMLELNIAEWRNNRNWMIYFVIFLIIVLIVYNRRILSSMFSVEMQSGAPSIASTYTNEAWKRKSHPKGRKNALNAKHVSKVYRESFVDVESENSYENVVNTLSKGIVKIFAFEGEDGQPISSATAWHIKDNVYVTAAHFMCDAKVGRFPHIGIVIERQMHVFPYPSGKLYRLDDIDMVFFVVPKSVPPIKSLYKYLASDVNKVDLPEFKIMKVLAPREEGIHIETVHKRGNGSFEYEHKGTTMIIEEAVTYYGDSKKGDSGAPVVVGRIDGSNVIIGLHVGRSKLNARKDLGLVALICKEYYDAVDAAVKSENTEVESEELFHGKFRVIKTVPTSEANVLPQKSKIRPSCFFGLLGPPTFVPAHLRPFINNVGERIDPEHKAMQKLQSETFLSEPVPEACFDWLKSLYPRRDVFARILTWKETLNGVANTMFGSIVGSTSAGYPYKLKTTNGKMPFLVRESENDDYGLSDLFAEEMEKHESDLRSGKQIEVLWADCLKDETRTIEKVEAGKTRLFCTCPLHYLLLVRKYFGAFVSYVQEFSSIKPVSVGINYHSLQWTELYNRFVKYANIIAGDYENFDGKIPSELPKGFVRFVNWWYEDGPTNARVRELLMEHVWHAIRINGIHVYETFDGNPSGNPITSIINSFVNMMIIYVVLTSDFGLSDDDFDIAVYGDDNIVGIKSPSELRKPHNGAMLRVSDLAPHILRRFNLKYTHWSKNDTDVDDNMLSISYLGRRFYPNNGVISAPLSMPVIAEMIYWERSDIEHTEYVKAIASAHFIELSHYKREVFEACIGMLLREIEEHCDDTTYAAFTSQLKSWSHYRNTMYHYDQFVDYRPVALQGHLSKTSAVVVESKDLLFENIEKPDVTTKRNDEFTERATNEAPPSQDVQLGAYHDVAPIVDGAVDPVPMQDPYQSCNMETFDLNKALEREYLVQTVAWSTSSGVGTLLSTIKLPDVLFTQNFIAQKIADFRYFRSGANISARMVTNRFQSGSLMVVYIPYAENDLYYSKPTNVYQWSGFPHMILSASAGEVGILKIPFIYPRRALDLSENVSTTMGNVYVVVLNPLIDSTGANAPAQLMINANFVDAELFAPHQSSGIILESDSAICVRVYVYQPIDEFWEPAYVTRYNVDGTYDIKYCDGSFETCVPSEHIRWLPSVTLQSESKEAVDKSIKGVISGASEMMKPVAATVSAIKPANVFKSAVKTVASPLASIGSMFGLSKPRTKAITEINKSDPFADINVGKGLSLTQTIGMDPANAISVMPSVGGMNVDEMSLLQLCGTPSLFRSFALTNTSTNGTICPVSFAAEAQFGLNCGFTEWMANNFEYVSSSRKVKIYFRTSLFNSARLVLFIAESSTQDWMNCYHKVVDIQGDTDVEFLLPYMSSYFARNTVGDESDFYLCWKVLSWTQPDSGVTSPVYVNAYSAAGSDLSFGQLNAAVYELESNPRNDFAHDFMPFHEKMTGYTTEGYIIGEKFESVREIIHKYHALSALNQNNFYPVYSYGGNANDTAVGSKRYMGVELFGLCYRYWRGSMRIKMLQRAQMASTWVTNSDDISGDPGLISANAISSTTNPVMDVDVPFYSNKLFLCTYGQTSKHVRMPVSGFWMKAAGDDFSFHFIQPPMPGTWSKGWDSGYGSGGLSMNVNNYYFRVAQI